ncbi:DEAD/DEAH box helicase [Desulfopila inferna]|uniref:DEAD/DEAH box helicase n=1 Tax=Desulfopila inferna TaxID=468528 RepID=UPI001963AF08|nr:DEAD/DEAH box helicase [Desulfopila inferna]MBM9606467.1 DEAD/DEAH box helicase [Desulfopila inferna]
MSFNDFQFGPHILGAVKKSGYLEPTPIQAQAMGPILEGHDLLGLAQTGTGKTAAFILPMVQHLLAKKEKHIRTLIIAPTRELAEQIHDYAEEVIENTHLRSMAIYGGVSKPAQIRKLREGVDIVVACPGRLLDILRDSAMNLDRVEHLILDEADHMFDQGFLPDIRRILGFLPRKRQTLVFSATMPGEIRKLAEEILHKPVAVQISRIQPADTVAHTLYSVQQNQKTALLLHLLKQNESGIGTALVFTRTKYKAKNLAAKLAKSGFKATSLQGNLSQNRRQEALAGFKDGTFNILVATDIAARGIDVAGISHVINFDAPDTAEAYIHRTGRTGRATLSGEAFLFATAEDGKIISMIEKSMNKKLQKQSVLLPHSELHQDIERPAYVQKRREPSSAKTNNNRSGRGKRTSRSSASAPVFGLNARCK